MESCARQKQRGFTLIELVVVILVAGILAALGGRLIVAPVTGYVDLTRRVRLVDQAELALSRMQRDLRQALPNSIRIDASGRYLELLHTVDGGRYRRYLGASGDDILDFTLADNGFDVLGDLREVPAAGQNLVVYNTSSSGSSGNAYAAVPGNMAAVGSGSSVSHVSLSPAFQFSHASPYQRFYTLDGPVTYACENGVLNRYAGYAIAASQPLPPSVTPALVTRNLGSCHFDYQPGSAQRAGLVSLALELSESGETVRLWHQVHLVNAP